VPLLSDTVVARFDGGDGDGDIAAETAAILGRRRPRSNSRCPLFPLRKWLAISQQKHWLHNIGASRCHSVQQWLPGFDVSDGGYWRQTLYEATGSSNSAERLNGATALLGATSYRTGSG
jgi:hypothetical protein